MGFIYKIEVEGELYIGSTKNKYLGQRQYKHNYNLNIRNANYYLYRFCREKKVEKIICELIEEVDNSELRLLEQEYIKMLEPSLNTYRAFQTEEEKKEQKKEHNKKNNKKHNKINNKIKSNCPICNKQFIKRYIKSHIKSQH